MRRLIFVTLLSLGGCQFAAVPTDNQQPIAPVVDVGEGSVATQKEPIIEWLGVAVETAQMSPAQALEELSALEGSGESEIDRFRFAMLNQQLDDRTGWIRARNTLRKLIREDNLDAQVTGFVTLLMQYNQSLINAEARQHLMAKELESAQDEQRQLQDKLNALTTLEESISTRKEKVSEANENSSPANTASTTR